MLRPAGSLREVTPTEEAFIERVQQFRDDPLGFVKYIFQWGEGELLGESGPDEWQTEYLKALGEKSKNGDEGAVRMAVSSGHGVGKTTMVAWIILWFMSTRNNPTIVVTANTQMQLTTKTWRELNKWHNLALNRHWFQWTATKFFHVLQPATWSANAVPWTEHNSEAFAGTHEKRGTMLIFDEASAISDVIWDVAMGAMTTTGSFWITFGNPTKATGRFYDCFHTMKHRWTTYKVDSRKAKAADQNQIRQYVEDYGEESDFVKVRVRGEFPAMALNQFISTDLVIEASKRRITKESYAHYTASIGVDVARYGDDESVIAIRQGPFLHEPLLSFRGLSTMEVASKAIDAYRRFGGNAVVCVDGIGIGAGVIDRLRQLGIRVIDVQGSAKPYDPRTYYNKRGELYGRMRDWLAVGCLYNDEELFTQLRAIEYQINPKTLQIQLAGKEDIKKVLGGKSPDKADALAYTFASEEQLAHRHVTTKRNLQVVNF